MPYITIHPIKSSLKRAIDYICKREKTNNYNNIYSEYCHFKTAHLVFEKTRKSLSPNTKNLAFHIIQSFPEGEVTAKQAMEIGQKTMERFLGGSYEFVLATHTDTSKIHTHIIINSVNMVNGKSFSREHDRINAPAWKKLYRISNEIAKEYGLSVVENALENSVSKSRSYYEWNMDKQGKSWKSQLKAIIDDTIRNTDSFESFISDMRGQGITVRYEPYKTKQGMILAFKMIGQKYFVYSKKLGKYYSENSIRNRIERSVRYKNMTASERRHERILNDNGELKKLYDIDKLEGIALQKWAKKENRRIRMKTLDTMRDKGFSSADELKYYISELQEKVEDNNKLYADLKKAKSEIMSQIQYANIYHEYKKIYEHYQNTFYPDQYFRNHEAEILLFKEAVSELKKYGITEPDVKELTVNLESVDGYLKKCRDRDRELHEEIESFDTIIYNLEDIYSYEHDEPVREPEKEPTEQQSTERKKRRSDDFDMEL